MNSIQKEQILRVNCPGFGEENYFSAGKAKSLDAYKVIIINPVSIFHLFDNDLKLQKEIDDDLADGLTSRTVASDSLLQSIQEELKTRRILELVSFLEKGGLLIYFLCRPFLVQGDNIAIDNYAWLESLAPDSSPDDNIRHMSAVSHGRVVEATPDGELSEFAPYLSQTGLEWNTIIRQDFLTDGYKPLATAGPRKCIAAQLMAGDQGGRILFLPAPYSPDFDKKLIECVQDWNIKTHYVEAVVAPVSAAVQAPVLAVAEPVAPAVAAVAPAAVPIVEAPAAVVAAPVPAPVVAEPSVAVEAEPAPVVAAPALVAATTAPVAVVEAPAPEAVIPNSTPVVEPPAQTTPIITPPPPVESAVIITPAPAPTPEIVVAPVSVVETPAAESIVASSSPIITPPPPVVSEPAAVVTPAPEVVATDSEATQNLVREMELLAQANPSAGNSSSFTPPAPAVEPVGAKIARGLFGDDDDDDRLDIGSPAFTGQSIVPQTASVEATVSPVVATPAPHVTPAPLIQTLIAASEIAAAASVIVEPAVSLPTAEALIPAIDETQEMKARQYSGVNIQHSLDLDAIEVEEVYLSTPAEVLPQTPVEEPKLEVEVPAVYTAAQIESALVDEGVLPAVSPLSSLPIEVMPMPETATASNGKINGNGNGNGNGYHGEEAHENYKVEEVDLANSLSSNSDLALFGVDAKQPEAKDLIKKMEEISKNTNSDVTFDIVLPQSEELRKKRVSLLDSIKQAQVEIANVENKITQIEHLKNALLRGEGDELLAACQRILTKLGWDAQPSEKSEQELYLLASDKPQALARVVRSTAQAKRTDVAELGESVCSFWGEHEIEAKGLMLASTWAERTLSERQEQDYTDGLAQFAQKKSLCLMTTLQLLCMYRDVEMGRLTADEARNRILDTNGRLAGFQVESPLVTV
jgi:hypothetical protein